MIALVSVAALMVVERFPVVKQQRWHDEKLAAARLSLEAMRVIKAKRIEQGLVIDTESDPHQTGLIGQALTPITSNTGYITAKRASTNPNFAAALVHMLRQAGVNRGDVVTVGVSGSFPALCVSTFAALETLGTQPIVIASVSSSEWGANDPSYTWLDMERTLVEAKLVSFRSIAASRGAIDDRGLGMSKEGRFMVDVAISRNGVERIDMPSLVESVDRRMQVYDSRVGNRPVKAYINVGGGSASVGTHVGKKQFSPGLNMDVPRGEGLADSVMLRYAERRIPVIHISSIEVLAKSFGVKADSDTDPPLGVGSVYIQAEPNRWLAAGGVLTVLAVMLAFIRLDVGMRILRGRRKENTKQPQQMV